MGKIVTDNVTYMWETKAGQKRAQEILDANTPASLVHVLKREGIVSSRLVIRDLLSREISERPRRNSLQFLREQD